MNPRNRPETELQVKKYEPVMRKRTFYNPDPDFGRPLYELPPEIRERMRKRLEILYGDAQADRFMPEMERILKVHYAHKPPEMLEKEEHYDPKERFSEKDMILITYGDIVKRDGRNTLSTLHDFVQIFDEGTINTLHILPFFPYSSDRGFSVVDFKRVNPELGDWNDIRDAKKSYDLMFDSVLNHVSSRSELFREFIKGNPRFLHFFIAYDSPEGLTPEERVKIFRPRTSDLLTPFQTYNGPKWLWTTFSPDQIDLNYRNPDVLMHILDGLLFYIRRGADLLRLDAVTYLWAEPGTTSIHLPQTHEIVKLLRDTVDSVASGVALVTETNVPHEYNVSYFGDGSDEAHMIYNFALPPLVLFTFYRGDATVLSRWADTLETPSPLSTYFNILDTHDGIGLMGARGILSGDEIECILREAVKRGAYISYRMTDGTREEPYEINATWWSAVNGDDGDGVPDLQVKRYIASRSIALVLKGVPGIYVHGAIGTSSNHDLVRSTGANRDVNRGIIDSSAMKGELRDPRCRLSLVTGRGNHLYAIRTAHRAFHPRGAQRVLSIAPEIFSVLRTSPEGDERILTLVNVTGRDCPVEISPDYLDIDKTDWVDLVSGKEVRAQGGRMNLLLKPYDILWLK